MIEEQGNSWALRPSRDLIAQMLRFGVGGAGCYLLNLAVFTLCVRALDAGYVLAAAVARIVSISAGFLLYRHWIFVAPDGHPGHQAARYLVLNICALCLSILFLHEGIALGIDKVPAQAVALAMVTPVTFFGNRHWSFRA
jgi:putative flippase GtrA